MRAPAIFLKGADMTGQEFIESLDICFDGDLESGYYCIEDAFQVMLEMQYPRATIAAVSGNAKLMESIADDFFLNMIDRWRECMREAIIKNLG